MTIYRTERDSIGEEQIPADALYGIHSQRAMSNFPDTTVFSKDWFCAMGTVKIACYETYKNFKLAAHNKFADKKIPLNFISDYKLEALISSANQIADGKHFSEFIVPAMQGGAGTSINMNINEIIANLSLHSINKSLGNYEFIDPIEEANIYQSTNDVVPTALTVAAMKLLLRLEEKINKLRFRVETIEQTTRNIPRIGYTQMQEAVPSSYGKLFSTYNEALSRDWWRVSKCLERIKVVNLGGSAIGTAIAVPRYFVMEAAPTLKRITKLPITRSENLPDATSNLDSFVEVHATLKAHAVNLEKMTNDIRLLSSNLVNQNEISIPKKQTGSSIMPGKINPVIVEFVISVAHKIYANDILISTLSGQGCLDLNAYLPTIGNALLESLNLLIAADETLNENLFAGITIDEKNATNRLYKSSSIVTALTPYIGYHSASELAKEMKLNDLTIFEANKKLALIDDEKIYEILKPQNLLKTGFSLNDLS